MKKNRIKLRRRIYPTIWSGIIVFSIYLLIRFATLSFSDNMGQADLSLKDAVFSSLCCKVMEKGSSLVSYTADEEEQYEFPVSLVADDFALQKFVHSSTVLTANAQEYSSLPGNNATVIEEEDTVQTINSGEDQNSMDFYEITKGNLSEEYILTNGAIYNSNMASLVQTQTDGNTNQLQLGYSEGDVYYEETEDSAASEAGSSVETMNMDDVVEYTLDQLKDTNFLVRNFYIVDSSTKVTEKLFDAEKLLDKDMTLKQENDAPQILIYHTHSQEGYKDSRPNNSEDTVVGVGNDLTEILEEDYDYNVIHDTTTYDIVNGALNRNIAYNKAEKGLDKILKDNPTIEVVIDLHRDSGEAKNIIIDGKETAKIMLFNGLSRDQSGPITYLDNPNLQDNLAFSLQLQLKSRELYPGLFIKNYLKSYRYNMHVRPKCLLVELGTQNNTVESAKNAMVPFAKILDQIL
ncbi:MAG: stage II sporulation protein P, partial [Herbinix sp.]|nr:stage II sporulation protein P [Herbinix sp.]